MLSPPTRAQSFHDGCTAAPVVYSYPIYYSYPSWCWPVYVYEYSPALPATTSAPSPPAPAETSKKKEPPPASKEKAPVEKKTMPSAAESAPVPKRAPIITESRSADERCRVGFWNFTGRDVTLTVAGQKHKLAKDRAVTLELPRQFDWRVDAGTAHTVQVPAAQASHEIFLRE
jgi:hypothetical protein